MGAEASRLAAPREVDQDIALTPPEYAACSPPGGEYIEGVRRHLGAVFHWTGFILGPRSRGRNGLVIQNELGVVLLYLAH